MAGLGYHDFTVGELVTEPNLQGYLMDQTVMVFASAAARTSALASPAEGMISYLSDVNLLYFYDGTAWTQIPATVNVRKNSTGSVYTRPRINFIEGTFVTLTVADDGTEIDVTISAAGAGDTIVRKTADETVNNSAALQNDDHLLFAVSTSTSYKFEVVLLIDSASTAADFKCDFTIPASATIYWAPHRDNNAAASYFDVGGAADVTALITGSGTLVAQTLGVAGTVTGLFLRGIVRVAGTSGNVQFRWAQNAATVANTKVLTDSYLAYRQIS